MSKSPDLCVCTGLEAGLKTATLSRFVANQIEASQLSYSISYQALPAEPGLRMGYEQLPPPLDARHAGVVEYQMQLERLEHVRVVSQITAVHAARYMDVSQGGRI